MKLIDKIKQSSAGKNIRNILFSLISAVGLLYYLSQCSGNADIRGTMFLACIWLGYYFLWGRAVSGGIEISQGILAGILSFFLALSFALGYQLETLGSDVSFKKAFAEAVLFSFSVFPVVLIIAEKLARNSFLADKNRYTGSLQDKRLLALSFAVVCVVWFAVWLAMWPGMFGYDGTYWYYDMENDYLSAKFSIPYQMIFYFFISSGNKLFGNYEIGFSVFMFLQGAYVLYVVYRVMQFVFYRTGRKMLLAAAVFFAVNLPVVILAFSSAQDAPFMAAFTMCILLLVQLSLDKQEFWKCRRNKIELLIWTLMLFIWRNNGVYAMVLVVPVSIFALRRYGKKLLLILLAAISLFEVYSGPVLTAVGADKSTTVTEMMSVPAVQLTCAWSKNRNEMSDEDLNEIYQYLSEDFLENTAASYYAIRISDTFKANLNTDKIKENPFEFFKTYLKIGLKYPKDYIVAWLNLTFGLWYPDIIYYDTNMYHPYIEYTSNSWQYVTMQNSDYITTDRESKFPLLQKVLDYLFGSEANYSSDWPMAFSHTYLLAFLYKAAGYFWCFVFAVLYLVVKRKSALLLPLALYAGLLLTVILSPVVLFRYVSPVVMSAPLLIMLLLLAASGRGDEALPHAPVLTGEHHLADAVKADGE